MRVARLIDGRRQLAHLAAREVGHADGAVAGADTLDASRELANGPDERPAEEQEVRRGNWFIGGDLASIDADGYVTHLGRANDIMKVMGYRVAPQEVEAVLSRHPQVGEVACGERQVRDGVSIIAAYVVPAAPDVVPDGDALMAYAAEHLAPYKCPRAVHLVERLPRTANGKVLRRALDAAPALRTRAG